MRHISNSRKSGVVLSYVLMALEIASTLLITPLMLRTMGQAEFGVYRLTAVISSYLLLLDLGIGNSVVRFISKFRVANDEVNCGKFLGVANLFYYMVAAISIITGVVLVVIFPSVFSTGLTAHEIQLGQIMLGLTVANAAITLATASYANVLIAFERFVVSKGISIIQISIRLALYVIALLNGWGGIGVVISQLITTIVSRAFYVYYVRCRLNLHPSFHNIERSFVKEIFLYSSLILLQMIATHLNTNVGQVLIGIIVPSSAAIIAVYSISIQLVQYFQTLGSAFNGVLMPGIVKMVENKASSKTIEGEMIRIGRIILIVLLLVFSEYLACGKVFIGLWAGEENISAYPIALLIMTAQLYILSGSVGNQVLWAMNAHKEQSIIKLIIVVLNVALSCLLIKIDALKGAALGTFLSFFLGDVVLMSIVFVKKIGISILTYIKGLFSKLWLCALISALAGFVLSRFMEQTIVSFMCIASLTAVVYVLLLYVFGFNPYEKGLFSRFIHIRIK